MFTEEQSRLLALNKPQNLVLSVLKDEILSITDLSRKTKIPRTSLYSLLLELKERGFLGITRKGKRHLWKLVPLTELHTKLFAIQDELALSPTNKEVGIITSQESQYRTYRGKDNLVNIYEEFGKLPRLTRVYAIQPNISAYSLLKNFPHERLVEINANIKKRKIIVEAVLQENFLEYYQSKLKEENKPEEDLFRAYGGRLADTTYIPKEFFNFDSEIMMHDNIVVAANWKELVAVVIKNKEIAGLMKEMITFIKHSGKKVDQNPQVADIIENLEK